MQANQYITNQNKQNKVSLPWATVGTSWFFGLVLSGGQRAAGGASTSVEFPEIKKYSSVPGIDKSNHLLKWDWDQTFSSS